MQYHFTLPMPPSVNSLYGGGSKQQRFKSAAYKAWLKNCPPMRSLNLQRVKIYYGFYFKTHARADCCNFEKAITDYLVAQNVIVDDSWQHIAEMTLTPMGVDKNNARVEIELVTCV